MNGLHSDDTPLAQIAPKRLHLPAHVSQIGTMATKCPEERFRKNSSLPEKSWPDQPASTSAPTGNFWWRNVRMNPRGSMRSGIWVGRGMGDEAGMARSGLGRWQ